MNFLTLIIFGIIIFLLLSTVLPLLIPVFIVILLISLLRGFFYRKSNYNTDDHFDTDESVNQSRSSTPPKHNAIDVEYTEREDDGDSQ